MYIAYNLLLIYLISPLIDLFVYDKKGENIVFVFDTKGENFIFFLL